ncbi:MAG: LysM peptidoglycan-binding domain-containing protein [Nonlabens sp.]
MSRYLWILLIGISGWFAHAQKEQINPKLIDRDFQIIKYDQVLKPFYAKLDSLKNETTKTLTVVHIGDSHMQGPYFPKYTREGLQNEFGNAGRGFVFPYRVAKTNGGIQVKFKSDTQWKSMRNVKSDGSDNVGISGINLETTDSDFLLEMNLDEGLTDTRLIEILSPHPDRFKLSLANQSDVIKSTVRFKNYKIQSGDYLGKIASKFGTSVSKIRELNNLKSDNISAGKTIKVPVKQGGKKGTENIVFSDLKKLVSGKYHLPAGNQQVYLRAAKESENYVLDGLILENDKSGTLYHAIGVNGTKFSDYNKFPRFFDQLSQLKPDLIIISLGTNESFYNNYSEEDLKIDMDQFNRKLLARGIRGNILLTSPPPSMKNKRIVNSLATAFSYEMGVFANLNSWAFYDLHSVSRTSAAMEDWYKAGLTARDKIHFIEPGYKLQAQLLIEALIDSYKSYQE